MKDDIIIRNAAVVQPDRVLKQASVLIRGRFIEEVSEDPLFVALNSYTTGLSPSVMEYLLGITVARKFGGRVSADEIGLPVTQSGYVLPCGSTALWSNTL